MIDFKEISRVQWLIRSSIWMFKKALRKLPKPGRFAIKYTWESWRSKIFITNLMSLGVTELFNFPLILESILVVYIFLKICSVLQKQESVLRCSRAAVPSAHLTFPVFVSPPSLPPLLVVTIPLCMICLPNWIQRLFKGTWKLRHEKVKSSH